MAALWSLSLVGNDHDAGASDDASSFILRCTFVCLGRTAKREPDTARRRGLRKRDATGVVTSEDSDTETQHAHKRGRHEQVSKVVWSERDPWRDK